MSNSSCVSRIVVHVVDGTEEDDDGALEEVGGTTTSQNGHAVGSIHFHGSSQSNAQCGEALVDGARLLERRALDARLFDSLRAGQIHKEELAQQLPCDFSDDGVIINDEYNAF